MMMNVEQLAFVLGKAYPDLKRCRDYWVAHPVDSADYTLQTGPAWLVTWDETKAPKPTPEELDALWVQYGSGYVSPSAA